jgi:hypothetical protein
VVPPPAVDEADGPANFAFPKRRVFVIVDHAGALSTSRGPARFHHRTNLYAAASRDATSLSWAVAAAEHLRWLS